MAHMWMRLVTYKRVMAHSLRSHITHLNVSCHKFGGVISMSRVIYEWKIHVKCINEPCPIYVCACACACAYAYACSCPCPCACAVRQFLYLCLCLFVCGYVCLCTCVPVCLWLCCALACIGIDFCWCLYMCVFVSMCIHWRVYTCVCTMKTGRRPGKICVCIYLYIFMCKNTHIYVYQIYIDFRVSSAKEPYLWL